MSKSEKLFTVVGTSVDPKGNLKPRFANELVSRIKNLTKSEHTEIDLIELPNGMTKADACQYYLDNKQGLSAEVIEVLQAKIAEKVKAGKRTEVKATLTKGKAKVKDKKPSAKVAKFVEENSTEKAE